MHLDLFSTHHSFDPIDLSPFCYVINSVIHDRGERRKGKERKGREKDKES